MMNFLELLNRVKVGKNFWGYLKWLLQQDDQSIEKCDI